MIQNRHEIYKNLSILLVLYSPIAAADVHQALLRFIFSDILRMSLIGVLIESWHPLLLTDDRRRDRTDGLPYK
jgi:hypothetical protein